MGVALVAGALAALNPCGFPLLPAYLSFYVGASEADLPRAPSRVAQGLAVGLLVTVGFLGVFAAIGLPLSYGADAFAAAVPWTGLAIGALLVAAGAAALLGRHVTLPVPRVARVERRRSARPILLFGVGYGLASLGCTLPIFLALVGAAVGAGSTLIVFAAYGIGMASVLMALSLAAALLREGLARALRRVLPHTERIAGALLVVAGAYLVYYWSRVHFGPKATLADDPVVGVVTRFTAEVQARAGGGGVAAVVAVAVVVAAAGVLALRPRQRRVR